jgi:anti-sigma regulatory factor (Ser/Thr protein kinase)
VPYPSRRGGALAPVPPSHHGHDLERWPLRGTLILGALPDAVPSARAHLRQLLTSWGRAALSPDVSVVVSELVTNSVAASGELQLAAAPVLVWLGSDWHCLLLAVADASPRPPVRLNLEPDTEGGRGLALVEALSSRWGWHPVSTTGLTKVTWAEWRLPSGAGRRSATGVPSNRRCHLAEESTMQGPPVPDPSRSHDVSELTDGELERIKRDLQASLALARPGAAACVPIRAHLSAVESELAERSAGRPR